MIVEDVKIPKILKNEPFVITRERYLIETLDNAITPIYTI
jgi:hypothetical protein